MVPRTGVLGAAALGVLVLGAPLAWLLPAPVVTRVRSAVSDDAAGSALSATGVSASDSGSGPRSAVSSGGVRSGISSATVNGGDS